MKRFVSFMILLTLAITQTLMSQQKKIDLDPICNLIGTGKPEPMKVLPPPGVMAYLNALQDARKSNLRPPSTMNAGYTVNYTGNWPADAKTALERAFDIWSSYLYLPQVVHINANMDDALIGTSTLATCGATTYWRVLPETLYRPVALAEAMTNSNLNGSEAEFRINVNPSPGSSWYWGTDGNVSSNQYDFVSVMLHEICHGIGFAGNMNWTTGGSPWGDGTHGDRIYDKFTEAPSGAPLLQLPQHGDDLAYALTHGVQFDGTNERIGRVRDGIPTPPYEAELYSPNTWAPGSSYSHLGENFNNQTYADLMTYSTGTGHAIHDPGKLIRGILEDMGWSTFYPIYGIYSQTFTDPWGLKLVPGTVILPSSGTVSIKIE